MKSGILVVAAAVLTAALAGPAFADGDADAGKKKAKACAACHGANGEGKGDNPALAGMDSAKFVTAMNEFKSGKRESKKMQGPVKKLSEDDIENLAAYYASLK